MTFNFTSSSLKITSSDGLLTVWAEEIPDRIEELSLSKLERLNKKWKHLIKEVSENVTQDLLNNPRLRKEIYQVLKEFGFKRYQHFTGSQIKSLLFLHENGSPLLWQFHSIFPVLELPETEEKPVDYSKYIPNLDPFETANFYLLQNDSLDLAEEWPLSKVMRLFVSKAFISWISIPENKQAILDYEFSKYVDDNPLDPERIKAMMQKGVT